VDSHFLHLATTPSVAKAQVRYQGRVLTGDASSSPDLLTSVEEEFIAARDSFYMASVTETGWPYVQHRGGPAGFLRVLAPDLIGFADVRGNRQMLTTGNVSANDRVALILVDYPQRSRLKIIGHASIVPAAEDPALAASLQVSGMAPAERLVRIKVVAFDWNCPKYITPRYTLAEIEAAMAPLRDRIKELETLVGKARLLNSE
jgi:predicted pyridoxine 5'-phosphate oxidase superfamily flavin-nucleotide-binding protein